MREPDFPAAARFFHGARATIVKATAAGDGNEKWDLTIKSPPLLPATRHAMHGASPVSSEELAADRYREGRSEVLVVDPPVFDPVVLESVVELSMTICVTSLLSGSISTIRSGSLTKRRFLVSGT
ncbi:hypothetical protein FXB40_12210 [Bradyrhizobium rifense]|uniref:Uncharacterized protein n=1 Tax=Bradyrhizobium rifense TaxID=515499 RepID=A0A5D3KGP2_9BRAD|nr:hypothetical protein [Bradyrhizobium rifense]TYL96382.1 hypothetical protein FXB40_12210 [Bradyrhizobium rifense]